MIWVKYGEKIEVSGALPPYHADEWDLYYSASEYEKLKKVLNEVIDLVNTADFPMVRTDFLRAALNKLPKE